MNRHERRKNRAANATPEQAETQRQLDAATPPGWSQRFVRPPWPRDKSGCRACGATGYEHGPWATCTMMRRFESERVLAFTFAMMCSTCAMDESKRTELANWAFGPPPN